MSNRAYNPVHLAWAGIGETLVQAGKCEITAEDAVRTIRGYMQMIDEPGRSKWILVKNSTPPHHECLRCCGQAMRDMESGQEALTNFCPYCGREMVNAEGVGNDGRPETQR